MRINFTTIESGDSTGYQDVGGLVVQAITEWEELWKEHTSILSQQPPLPSIDFAKEMVIAYFAGEKRQGGHRAEIDSVEVQVPADPRDQKLVIRVSAQAPERLSTDVMAQPYHIVRVPRVPFVRATFEIL